MTDLSPSISPPPAARRSRPMGDAREHPILFSAPMIRAILAGRKTMTRRVLKPQPQKWQAQVIDITEPMFDFEAGGWGQVVTEWAWFEGLYQPMREMWQPLRSLRWQPGDRLWVREQFSGLYDYDEEKVPPSAWFQTDPIWYWADGNPPDGDWTKPKPSIHMPRWASRITLLVEAVRIERLQDISEADAVAEGMIWPDGADPRDTTLIGEFIYTWTSINGPGSWDANPWVSVTIFRRVQ